jgi:hypothetical protein
LDPLVSISELVDRRIHSPHSALFPIVVLISIWWHVLAVVGQMKLTNPNVRNANGLANLLPHDPEMLLLPGS